MKKILKFGTLIMSLLLFVSCGGGGSGDGGTQPPPNPDSETLPPPIPSDDSGTLPPPIPSDDTGTPPLPIPSDTPSLQNVLILYDTAGTFGERGKMNALLLENLLGHFSVTIASKPADQYIANEMADQNITTVFYLGTTFDVLSYYQGDPDGNTGYLNFYKDAATQNKTIVWMNYNLDLLETKWDTSADNWGGSVRFISLLALQVSA